MICASRGVYEKEDGYIDRWLFYCYNYMDRIIRGV